MVKPATEQSAGGKSPDPVPSWVAIFKPCAVALLVALQLAVLAGLHRIWSQFSAANAPLGLLWPFARPLAAAAVETAFLLGIPVGLGAAAFHHLSRADGAPWLRVGTVFGRSALPVIIGLSVVSVGVALTVDPGTSHPGELAGELVEQARRGCSSPDAPKEIEVPLVKVRWQCSGGLPRVVGTAPIGRAASFSASEIRLNEDLTRIQLRDLRLEAGATPRLRVQAGAATIAGLHPWGRPQKMPPLARGGLLGVCTLLAALLVALVVLGFGVRSRVEPWLTGSLVAAALWGTLQVLDRGGYGYPAYALLPVAALLAAGSACLLGRAVVRVARR
jgi:hypothetical protein